MSRRKRQESLGSSKQGNGAQERGPRGEAGDGGRVGRGARSTPSGMGE